MKGLRARRFAERSLFRTLWPHNLTPVARRNSSATLGPAMKRLRLGFVTMKRSCQTVLLRGRPKRCRLLTFPAVLNRFKSQHGVNGCTFLSNISMWATSRKHPKSPLSFIFRKFWSFFYYMFLQLFTGFPLNTCSTSFLGSKNSSRSLSFNQNLLYCYIVRTLDITDLKKKQHCFDSYNSNDSKKNTWLTNQDLF